MDQVSAKDPFAKKASSKGAQTAAQKRLAAQRALAAASGARAARRRRLLAVGAPVVAVLVVVGILIAVKVSTGAGGPKSGQRATNASSSVVTAATSVPPRVLDAIGTGTVKALPKPITAPPLTRGGKPRVLYAGAEYCPYCAAERWAAVVALSRFGTFRNLGQTASSPSDVYPSTATLTFHGASYHSKYVAFTGKEMESNRVVNGRYATLDKLSPADQKLYATYDSAGSIPFVDIGGKYVVTGASYDPGVLHGKTHAQIAAALSDPSSPIAKAVGGTANVLTAAICSSTGNKPGNVCTSSGVTAAKAALNRAAG